MGHEKRSGEIILNDDDFQFEYIYVLGIFRPTIFASKNKIPVTSTNFRDLCMPN